ncbi:hypothetical protein B0J14DRAFT_642840 [Halenospora varia]|nr:hypothetical protein B0J14DRAFT_642840 [Halenospora varia]
MKVFSIIAATLLPLAVFSSPLSAVEVRDVEITAKEATRLKNAGAIEVRDAAAKSVGLFKRKDCDVVNVVTEVDCWWLPKHGGSGNEKITSYSGTRNNINFSCWTKCERVGGITTWFWTRETGKAKGCYVPGYYLDNSCVSTGSGALPQCAWAASDRAQGGCD